MTIWRGKTVKPANDAEIHVKYAGLSLSDDRKQKVADAVQRARYMLAYVIATIRSADTQSAVIKKHAHYYFKTPPNGFSAEDADMVKSALELVLNGLASSVNVKVSKTDDSIGYVNLHHKARKGRWTKGFKSGIGTMYRGDIHVSKYRLGTGIKLAAKTVIHEASHKFASTADFGERGYTWDDDGTFRNDVNAGERDITHAEALNNAESYARFVLHVFDEDVGWA